MKLVFFKSSPKGIFIDFTERRREREREKHRCEKHQSVASRMYPDWDQTCNIGMCPDLGSKSQPPGAQPTNLATWPEVSQVILKNKDMVLWS